MSKESTSSGAELPPMQQAIAELRRLRAKVEAADNARSEKIAIVGIGLRLPGGVVDCSSYWQLLADGVDAVTEIPSDRWQIDDYFDPDPDKPGKMITRHGGFIDSVDEFDADFFRISPREAVAMDPQQRLLLEVTWEAFENAGIAPSGLAGGRSGVFIGFSNSDYARILLGDDRRIDAYTGTGFSACVAAGRLSYTLGLTGPSMAIDTACSASLAAIAQGCRSLRNNECDVAVAGGVNLILTPELNIAFSKARMMAADGKCKTFDAKADGYVRGEGCAVLILKRLSDAERDKDPIHALVRGVAVNQDGASSGLTVPSGPAQESVVREALADGRVDPDEVDYVEAHGTATSLGDPIEIHALGAVFGNNRPADNPLMVGSVKTNIGHLETVAGIAGVIKVALSLKHKQIPANLHFEEPSRQIDWDCCPLEVPTSLKPWRDKTGSRIAGVSSFGFSGTNAHIVLEEAPQREVATPAPKQDVQVLCLSALGKTPLRTLAKKYARQLQQPENSLSDIAMTANTGRAHLSHRLAVLGSSSEEVADRLLLVAEGSESVDSVSEICTDNDVPQIGFLFTGQGAQYVGMGKDLYDGQPAFRESMNRCNEYFINHRNCDLLSVMFSEDVDTNLLQQTEYAQPALFALEVSLAELWRSWGIEPSVVLGHSVGEYAAACVAGVFSIEDGMRLISERGRLMQATSQSGAMAAVFANAGDIKDRLDDYAGRVVIAAINSPENTVISGESSAVVEVLKQLEEADIKSQCLEVSHAFHSPLIEPALEEFGRIAEGITYHSPQLDIISASTGEMSSDEFMRPEFWVEQSRQPVLFQRAFDSMIDSGCRLIVEVGPHPSLLAFGRACRPDDDEIVWQPSLRRGIDDQSQLAEASATLYVNGALPDWAAIQPYGIRLVDMPVYPFERERFWLHEELSREANPTPESASRNAVLTAGRDQAAQVPIDLHVETYAAKWSSLNNLARSYIRQTLIEVGAFPQADVVRSVDEIVEDCGFEETYRILLGRWLEHLVADGSLVHREGGYASPVALNNESLASDLSVAQSTLEDIPLMMEYVERSGTLLTKIVTGKETALETLFPDGSTRTANWLYKESALSRYFNSIAAVVVGSFSSYWPEQKPLRLLEVGAGTGSTTVSILPRLPADRTVYAFTDISDFFLSQAKELFEPYKFMRYGLLNLEQDPASQGFEDGSFDVIIAANVLHATRNLEQTVSYVRSLLAPDGLLILIEVTDPPQWYDVSVSLIEGWQLFEDSLRKDSPLIPVLSWIPLLEGADFEAVEALPGDSSAAAVMGTRVIVARAPSAAGTASSEIKLPEMMIASEMAAQCDDSYQEATETLLEQLKKVPANERLDLLAEVVTERINIVLRRSQDKPLNRRQNLMDLGLDSLMAVELRNRLTEALHLGEPLPVSLIFDYPNIQAIATFLDSQLSFVAETSASDPETDTKTGESGRMAVEDIEDLSDDEVEALLNERLAGGGES